MVAVYTTVEHVKASCKFIDLENISDEIIVNFIEDSQGQINSLIKTSYLNNFDINKHAILRELCTYSVIVKTIACSPATFYSSDDRSHTLEICYNIIKINSKLLSDPQRVKLLE